MTDEPQAKINVSLLRTFGLSIACVALLCLAMVFMVYSSDVQHQVARADRLEIHRLLIELNDRVHHNREDLKVAIDRLDRIERSEARKKDAAP